VSYTLKEKLAWELHGLQHRIDLQKNYAETFASMGRKQQALNALFELSLAKDELSEWKRKNDKNSTERISKSFNR
jgi:hypothetical protein